MKGLVYLQWLEISRQITINCWNFWKFSAKKIRTHNHVTHLQFLHKAAIPVTVEVANEQTKAAEPTATIYFTNKLIIMKLVKTKM